MADATISPEEYLRRPYKRLLVPDPDSGGFSAMIEEFPGCITEGETPDEACSRLEIVAAGWIEAALELKQEIPEPQVENTFSGRFALRLPKSVHRDAATAADRDGTSLNQFILAAISERIGMKEARAEMKIELQKNIREIHYDVFLAAATGVNVGINLTGAGNTAVDSSRGIGRINFPNG